MTSSQHVFAFDIEFNIEFISFTLRFRDPFQFLETLFLFAGIMFLLFGPCVMRDNPSQIVYFKEVAETKMHSQVSKNS